MNYLFVYEYGPKHLISAKVFKHNRHNYLTDHVLIIAFLKGINSRYVSYFEITFLHNINIIFIRNIGHQH